MCDLSFYPSPQSRGITKYTNLKHSLSSTNPGSSHQGALVSMGLTSSLGGSWRTHVAGASMCTKHMRGSSPGGFDMILVLKLFPYVYAFISTPQTICSQKCWCNYKLPLYAGLPCLLWSEENKKLLIHQPGVHSPFSDLPGCSEHFSPFRIFPVATCAHSVLIWNYQKLCILQDAGKYHLFSDTLTEHCPAPWKCLPSGNFLYIKF